MKIRTTVLLVLVLVLGLFLVLGTLYLTVGLGWLAKPAEILDADEAQRQYTALIEQFNVLESKRTQISSLQGQIDTIETMNAGYADMNQWSVQDRADWQNLNTTLPGLVTAYNRECAAYRSAWANWFESGGARVLGLQDEIQTTCEMIGN